MARTKSVEELRAKTLKLEEQLKKARAEERKARQLEESKRKKEEHERAVQEALQLIEISKKVTITGHNENGEKEVLTVYEFLKRNCK